MAKMQNNGEQTPKKKSAKTVSTLKRTVTEVSKGSDGSTRTTYPKQVSSNGLSSQLTRIEKPVKVKKKM
jgi:hypothetical protein